VKDANTITLVKLSLSLECKQNTYRYRQAAAITSYRLAVTATR